MSYNIADMKWGPSALATPSGVITWSSDIATGLNFTGAYAQPDFDLALQAAFDKWEDSAAVDFEYTADFGTADITVDMASLPGATVGRATTYFLVQPGIDEIVESDIEMDQDEQWAPYGDGASLSFYAVALHEIGHAIGLEHVNDTTEIMNPTIFANDLGDGDVDGARALYGADVGDAGGDPDPDATPTPALSDPGSSGGDGGGGAGGLLGLLLGAIFAIFGVFAGPAAAVGMAVGLGRGGSGGSGDAAGSDDADGDALDAAVDAFPGGAKLPADSSIVDDVLAELGETGTPVSELLPELAALGLDIDIHSHDVFWGGEGGIDTGPGPACGHTHDDGHEHMPDAWELCDGYCDGTCGDPEHLDAALAAIV